VPPVSKKVTAEKRVGISVPVKLKSQQNLRSPQNQFNLSRAASTTSVGMQEKIQSRLRKKSPWYDSITKPITGGGVKIPDPIGTDTGTYQHVQNVTVSVTAGGICGLRVICPYINNFDNSDGYNYQISNPGAPTASVTWGDGTATQGGSFPFATIPDLMRANARSHRVVSACVIAQPEISTLNDAGEMCAFVTPLSCKQSAPGPTSNVILYSDYQAQWDSSMIPVNAHKPVIARWYPLEGEFKYFNGSEDVEPADHEPNLISYRDFVSPGSNSGDDSPGVIPFEFGVLCKGMTPSTGVVRFQIVVNYEFIPLLSTAMVTVDSSPIDPMEEQLVNQWVSRDPVTSVISQKEASVAPTPTTVREEPSGFGMLYNVIEEILPLAAQAAPKILAGLL